ncbi:hypothetical protein MB901379_01932 [Mycobacterium basiliense]|uniref:Uncharacterized protein n=1 Tax=Mycobacterium basiliense TaxID=2094119 RepID=A0A447GCZ0_9MYCO|nr:hypothetical protein MB901379_01932 [Mycobacterium basiliense]
MFLLPDRSRMRGCPITCHRPRAPGGALSRSLKLAAMRAGVLVGPEGRH